MKNIYYCVFVVIIAFLSVTTPSFSQGNLHQQSPTYEWPEDPLVLEKLEQWRDLKFGIIIHWGLYAVPGIIESWALCSENWIERDSTISYDDFKKWYWNLNKDFNPVNFNPSQWAQAANDAGMRYLVFTTKHHDGFNMFDTQHSDFKITNGPFSDHPMSNVTYHVFEAFRKHGFMIGAYYSKPDWHSEYYWWPKYSTPDRNNNYDIRRYPWRWNKFKEFTHHQIRELVNDYGSIDILWLDGGWVRPLETVTDEVRAWGAAIPEWNQDVDIPRIAAMARAKQPGLLVVDRTVHGLYENYQTPEQRIPTEKYDHPWESCMTLGDAWGYVPNDQFKSTTKVIHTLIEVVAKGGNLLLGVGPQADGTLMEIQVQRLKEIGAWLKINGEGIYNTRPVNHYKDDNTYFTQGKDGTYYAITLLEEGERIPKVITWSGNVPKDGTSMKLLFNGKPVKWRKKGNMVEVSVPAGVVKTPSCSALVFSFTCN